MTIPKLSDLSQVIATTPIPVEVMKMATYEPDHDLSAPSQLTNYADNKLSVEDLVVATLETLRWGDYGLRTTDYFWT